MYVFKTKDNINEYFWMGLNDRRTEGSLQWDHRPNMVMVSTYYVFGDHSFIRFTADIKILLRQDHSYFCLIHTARLTSVVHVAYKSNS